MRAPFDPGALYVRRAALIEAQADIVWNAFESEDRMRTWFGYGHTLDRYEPQLGGTVELSVALDDGVHRFGGAITHFEPGHSHIQRQLVRSPRMARANVHQLRLT